MPEVFQGIFEMQIQIKYFLLLFVLIAVAITGASRLYREFIPQGISEDKYIFVNHSVFAGHLKSPTGLKYELFYNDGGAMHSGNHWTWLIGYKAATGRFVASEGYLGRDAFELENLDALVWDGENPLIPYRDGRYK